MTNSRINDTTNTALFLFVKLFQRMLVCRIKRCWCFRSSNSLQPIRHGNRLARNMFERLWTNRCYLLYCTQFSIKLVLLLKLWLILDRSIDTSTVQYSTLVQYSPERYHTQASVVQLQYHSTDIRLLGLNQDSRVPHVYLTHRVTREYDSNILPYSTHWYQMKSIHWYRCKLWE
jgi:hypothetical protein